MPESNEPRPARTDESDGEVFARLIAAAEADMQSEVDRFGEYVFDIAGWLREQQDAQGGEQ